MMCSGRAGWSAFSTGFIRSNEGGQYGNDGQAKAGTAVAAMAEAPFAGLVENDGAQRRGPPRGFGAASATNSHRLLA